MFTLKIKNNRGEIFELTHNRRRYSVLNITGLTLPQCSINTSSAGTSDGSEYNSSHLNPRNIVITLALEGDIETNRQQLYRMFPLHSPVTLFYRTYNRDLHIDGYVETIDGGLFEQRETIQISLICPDPYFRDSHPITGQTSGGSCIIRNGGDAPVGFTAEVTVHTDDEPTLSVTLETSETAAEMRRHCACLGSNSNPAFFTDMDFGTQTVNVSINGALCAAGADYTADLLTFPDNHRDFWLESLGPDLTNARVDIEKIIVDGQNITDMRYFCSDTMLVSSYIVIAGIPSWFDLATDCIVFAYVSGAIGRKVPTKMTAEQQTDGTYILLAEFATAELDKRMECRIYGSVSKIDVHDATISREQLTWNLYPYRGYILSPVIPAHDPRDIFRIYNGTELLENADYSIQTVTKSDGTAAQYFELSGGRGINPALVFEVIKSKTGEDIHDYTQTQIDEGLCLVDGLTLTNLTTDESMSFPDIQFRSGDKFTISTVQGSLFVTVMESDWMPVGKSLLYEVLRHGQFFKLIPGENRLSLTADSNPGYVSCSLRAEKLYGGV